PVHFDATRNIIGVSAVHKVSKGPMSSFPTEILSSERIESIEHDVIKEAEAGWNDGAWQKLQPLRQAQQHHQHEAANSLLRIIAQCCLPIEAAADVLLE